MIVEEGWSLLLRDLPQLYRVGLPIAELLDDAFKISCSVSIEFHLYYLHANFGRKGQFEFGVLFWLNIHVKYASILKPSQTLE